ncbi:hypothetical protein RRG08_033701 [Elysia crispata]|uniref:Uncharacterized protein n=1 Tax=Elysia crispata TaxID=231223 RepID=A0AAE1A8X2_9GAST|nr:hypothetical protein RRG08_033701 [Elysia crispata]
MESERERQGFLFDQLKKTVRKGKRDSCGLKSAYVETSREGSGVGGKKIKYMTVDPCGETTREDSPKTDRDPLNTTEGKYCSSVWLRRQPRPVNRHCHNE